MKEVVRRYSFLVVLAVVLLFAALLLASQSSPAPAALPGIEVGVPVGGQNAVEFVGRVDQDGANFASYGYLTRINGLAQSLLFSTTNPLAAGEATARFTFYTSATITSHFVITSAFNVQSSTIASSLFVIDSVGTTVYYFHDAPGSDFADPNSFATGIPVVTMTVRHQDVLNVQSANHGIATGDGEALQIGTAPFTLNGQTYHIGRDGLMERLTTTGEGTRLNPFIPTSVTVLSGNAVVSGLPGQQLFAPIIVRNAP
jgi:hypothetical protein